MVPIQALSKYVGMMMVVIMMMIMMLYNYDNNKSRIQELQGHVWRVSFTAISFLSGSAEVDVVCPAIKCITYHSNTQTMNYSHYTFVLTLKLQPQEHIDSWSDSFE